MTNAKKPLTKAQLAALAKGRAARKQSLKDQENEPKGDDSRWAQLLDGTITVRDLDDAEIRRGRVRINGRFEGRPRRLPSHLLSQFQQEAIRRAKLQISQNTSMVTRELLAIARDPDVKDADRIKVLMYLQDRQLGKAPETIRVEGASPFDEVTMEALGLDREMADMQGSTEDDGPRSR